MRRIIPGVVAACVAACGGAESTGTGGAATTTTTTTTKTTTTTMTTTIASGGSGGMTSTGASGPGWSLSFGGEEHDHGTLAADDAGNVLFAGGFNGADDISGNTLQANGYFDVFVAKLGPDGKALWSKRFGDSDQQLAQAVAAGSSGSVVVAGEFFSSIDFGGGALVAPTQGVYGFLAALGAGGDHEWSRMVGPISGSERLEMAVSSQGAITMGAVINHPADFGGGVLPNTGTNDLVLASYDADGTPLWSRVFPSGEDEHRCSLHVDASGNIVLAGGLRGSIDFGGGALSASQGRLYLAKLAPDGTHVWSKTMGGIADPSVRVTDLAIGPDGSVHVVGVHHGDIDVGGGVLSAASYATFLAKFDASGAHEWSRSFEMYGGLDSVAVEAGGGVLVAGVYDDSPDLGGGPLPATDQFVLGLFAARFDASGAHVWSGAVGELKDSIGFETAKLALGGGNVYLQSKFYGTVDMGHGPLTSHGFTDLLVTRFDPSGP